MDGSIYSKQRWREREKKRGMKVAGKMGSTRPHRNVCPCDRVEIASRRLKLDIRTDYKTAKEREKELFEKQKRDILMGKGPRRRDIMP